MDAASITLDASVDSKGFQKGIENIKSGTDNMKKALFGVAAATSNAFGDKAQAKIEQQERKVAQLREEYNKIASGDVKPKSLERMEDALYRIDKEAERLSNKIQALYLKRDAGTLSVEEAAELDTLSARFDILFDRSEKLRAAIEQIRLNPETSDEAKNLANNIIDANTSLGGMITTASTAESQTKRAMNTNPVNKFGNSLKNAAKKLISLVFNMKLFSRHARNSGNAVSKFGNRLGSLIKAAFVFNIIRRGLSELSKYLSSMLKTNAEFVSSLNSIKVSLLTAFQPVFEAALPAINAIMSALARVAAYIAAFTNALFGKTIEQSKASAKAINEAAKAIDGTGKSAQKANKQLAAFDDLMKLSEESASDAGGTMTGLDFETVEIPEIKLPDIDFYEFGVNLSKKITDALNSIEWDKVKETARIIAVNIGNFINGFLGNPEIWAAIATTIGEGLNTALTFSKNLIETIKWDDIGKGIVEGLNTLVDLIDPELISDVFAGIWNAVVDVLYEIITNFKWHELGSKITDTIYKIFNKIDWGKTAELISNGIVKLISLLSSIIINTDWYEIGKAISTFLTNINWNEIISELAYLIGAAIGGLGLLLWGFIEDAVKEIGAFFYEAFDEAGGDIVLGLLWGIVKALVNIGQWLIDNVFTPIWEGFKSMFGIASPSTVMAEIGEFIMQGLLNGIMSLIDAVIGFFSGLLEGIQNVFIGIGQWFSNIFSGAWKGIKNAWTGVTDFFGNIWTGIKNAFGNVADWFRNIFSRAWQAVKDVFSKGGRIFDGIKDGILSVFKTVVNGIIDGINTVVKIPFDGINTALRKIKGIDILGIKPFSWINEIGVPQIPRLARGGVLKAGQIGLLEGTGAEAVVPLEYNTGWIKKIANEINANLIPRGRASEQCMTNDYNNRRFNELLQKFSDIIDEMSQDIIVNIVGKDNTGKALAQFLTATVEREQRNRGGRIGKRVF